MRSATKPSSDPRSGLALHVLGPRFGICRLGPDAEIPEWAHGGSLSSISRSDDELSIVCEEGSIPTHLRCERGWRAIKVLGPLDFSLIGVLAALAEPLTRAKISIFSLSTFDTDYLLVRDKNLSKALQVLREAGHTFDRQARTWSPDKRERRPQSRRTRDERGRPEEEADSPEDGRREAPRVSRGADDLSSVEPLGRRGHERAEIEARSHPSGSVPDRLPAPAAEEAPALSENGKRRKPGGDDGRERRPKRKGRTAELDGLAELAKLDPKRDRKKTATPRPAPAASSEEVPAAADAAAESLLTELEPWRAEAKKSRERPAETEPSPRTRTPSKPKATRRDEAEEGASAEGLFTGAIPQHPVETVDEAFDILGLSPPILRTIAEVGFVHPTPVQDAVIPPALEGKDVVGLAETGSGKTAAFVLPMAEHLTHGSGIRGLILCPTREIALQTKAFLDIFGRDHELDTVSVIGGVRMGPQIEGFRRHPDILVATPGRLSDHMRRGNVSLERIEKLVLDEADHMLDLGFLPQIQEILEQIPVRRQTMMFSATMPPPIRRLTQVFMQDPLYVDLRPDGKTAAGIENRLYLVSEGDRKKCLMALLKEVDGSTLIFVRRKLHTEWLARQIELSGFEVERIHSDRSQGQRVQALKGFREGEHRVLVATDVAARGLDIPGIRHVINFGVPETVEDYVHRAGRTARGSAKGTVSTIGTWQDKELIRDLEAALGEKLPRCAAEGVEAYRELKQRKQVRRRRLL